MKAQHPRTTPRPGIAAVSGLSRTRRSATFFDFAARVPDEAPWKRVDAPQVRLVPPTKYHNGRSGKPRFALEATP
ncbi:hypothetical protein SCOR_19510 [Sulfidibacter corallicola]